MKRIGVYAALGALGLWATAAGAQEAAPKPEDGGPPASTQEQIDKMDQGPDSVDVSSYPAVQQDNYRVFAAKCSKCHTLARPINSPYALPEEWRSYVTKMRGKKGSGIDEEKAAAIIDFLTYDSTVRKKDIIDQKLANQKGGKAGDKAEAGDDQQTEQQADQKADTDAGQKAPAKKEEGAPKTGE